MTKQEMLDMMLMTEYRRPVLVHPKNPLTTYVVTGMIKAHVNGEWIDMIQYTDFKNQYARPADEFGKFSEFLAAESII